MSTVTCMIAKGLAGILVLWLVATLIPSRLFGAEVARPSPETSTTPADVILTVPEGVLSLRAQDTSLKAILDAIGRQLHIAVEARIPADECITIAFDHLMPH